MSKTVRRLFIAFFISASGFTGTITWYRLTDAHIGDSSQAKQIARLASTVNDVQKKSVQRIIWQPVSENEVLRVGEAIRTGPNAEARIEFTNSSTVIDLEADSAIVLEENNGTLSLDFLKGNILVKSDGDSGSGKITLKSGDKEIALGQSELTLGKSKTGGLDLQVLSGSVEGMSSNEAQIKFKNLTPGMPLYVTPNANDSLTFEWEPLPKGYEVILEAGNSRENMIPVPNAHGAGETGTLKAQLKVGKNFYRLVARSQDPKQAEKVSAIMRSQVIAKISPLPLAPEKGSTLTVGAADTYAKLLWSNPGHYKKFILEIATSANLKENFRREDIEAKNEFKIVIANDLTYYWRISGVLEGRKEVVASAIYNFKTKKSDNLLAPILELPKNLERIPESTLSAKGLALSWLTTPGAVRYRIKITEQLSDKTDRQPTATAKSIEHETQFLQHKVQNLKSGTYQWTVAAINSKNESSKPSETRTFSVHTLPNIPWADGKTSEEFYYLSLKPSVTLKWGTSDSKATKWVVKITTAETESIPITKTVQSLGADVELPNEGRFFATIEAFDDRTNLVARSSTREIKVMSAPLLPPPQFAADTPKEIEASGSGQASIQWLEVQGAQKYVVKIKSQSSEGDKEFDFSSVKGMLRGLMPGEYKLSLRSVDTNGRIGPEGESRVLKVPNQSNVRAPKLKGVKFK